MLAGVDVSRYQTTTPSLAGVDFLIARATYGDIRDSMFAPHIRAARDAGLVTGAYLFGRSAQHVSLEGQIAAFVEAAGDVDLYALDLESDGPTGTGMTNAEARFVLDGLAAALHRPVGLYHSTSGYPSLGQAWRWVADYRPLDEPPIAWDIWQWTSFVGGVHLDRNRFRGTRAELVAMGGRKDPDMEWTQYAAIAEDWRPSDRGAAGNDAPIRLIPDRARPIVARIAAGTIIRTIGQFLRDGEWWRITRLPDGRTGYIIRGDIVPVTPGGDPTVDDGLRRYVARDSSSELARVKAAAVAAIQSVS
jgi:hypothetical protein